MLTESPEITRLLDKSKAEATLKSIRQGIVDIVEEKFSEIPVDLVSQLAKFNDVDRLRELQRLVIKSSDLEEFKFRAAF